MFHMYQILKYQKDNIYLSLLPRVNLTVDNCISYTISILSLTGLCHVLVILAPNLQNCNSIHC